MEKEGQRDVTMEEEAWNPERDSKPAITGFEDRERGHEPAWVQNMPPPTYMPFWHINSFQFKVREKQQIQDNHSDLTFFFQRQEVKFLYERYPTYSRRKVHSNHQGQEVEIKRMLYKQTLLK